MEPIKILNCEIKLEDIARDDMPNEIMEEVHDICGADVALKLLLNFQGNNIQVPTKGLKNIEKKIILKHYDGTTASIRSMARKMIVSENYIRSVIKNPPVEGQLDLWGNN